jgi:hypothetical protein
MTFLLTCKSECEIHFEPEGSQHHLDQGDSIRVELLGEPDYLEISHSPGRLSVWTEGCEVRAWNKAGAELRL